MWRFSQNLAAVTITLTIDGVMTNFLRVGLNAVNERKDHFFATQPASNRVKQIKESEDHHSIIIKVNRGAEVVASWTNISRSIS